MHTNLQYVRYAGEPAPLIRSRLMGVALYFLSEVSELIKNPDRRKKSTSVIAADGTPVIPGKSCAQILPRRKWTLHWDLAVYIFWPSPEINSFAHCCVCLSLNYCCALTPACLHINSSVFNLVLSWFHMYIYVFCVRSINKSFFNSCEHHSVHLKVSVLKLDSDSYRCHIFLFFTHYPVLFTSSLEIFQNFQNAK